MAENQCEEESTSILPSEDEDESLEPPTTKKAKLPWQETLITLLAKQQEQIAQLTHQSKMAAEPTPHDSPTVGTSAQVSTSSTTSFRLSEFNPDTSNYSMEEWLEDASRLKEELSVSDMLMIAKAGEALKGRGHRYYCDWRPVNRTWNNFTEDLVVAFPDRETPGVRAFNAATLRSRDCDSLSDYGIQKLRCINRFCKVLPWATTVSMVEYGLDHLEAQASIRMQQPTDERHLLKLLSELDARRRKSRVWSGARAEDAKTVTSANRQHRIPNPPFHGICYQCGQRGHPQKLCRNQNKRKSEAVHKEKQPTPSLPTCTHCKKFGHNADSCWFKHGKQKKVLLIRKGRLAKSPIATVLCDNKALSVSYVIDTGADISLISQNTALKLNAVIKLNKQVLTGLGNTSVFSLGTCEVIAVLPAATIEIVFTVVYDDVMPADIDAIIGWDVIRRPNLRLEKCADGVELHHDLYNIPKVLTVRDSNVIDNIHVSGLDEQAEQKLKQLLIELKRTTPDHIITGKLTIKLKDAIPVAYRPRRLAYAERAQVQHIVRELLQDGIIRESHSAYASPIVLVKKKNGDLRMCVDYRDINKKAVKERYPLPFILDQIDSLCHAKYFTTLDMKSGFHQMEIEENLNTTIHSTTGFAPSVLQFGTNPRLPATQQFLANAVPADLYIDPDKAVALAQTQMTRIENMRAKQFNSSRYAATLFSVGDEVVIENSQLAGGGKLKHRYNGPYTVLKILPNERYLLGKKGKRTTVAAHEQLRQWPVQVEIVT